MRAGIRILTDWILLSAFAVLLCACSGADENDGAAADSADAATAVVVTTAQQKDLPQTIDAYGQVRPDPLRALDISMPGSGRIAEVFVRSGQTVARGDALLAIEPSPGDTAQYEQAAAAVEYAESAYARTEAMLQEKLATRDQLAQAKKELTAAKAERDRLLHSGAGHGRRTLSAPRNGVVTALNVQAGDRLQGDALLTTIVADDAMQAVLGVEAAEAKRLQIGDTVHLRTALNDGVEIDGKIGAIARMVDPASGLVDVIVPLQMADGRQLAVGMTLRGQISLASWSGVVIPHDALMQDNNGLFAFVVSDNVAHKVPVTIIVNNASEVGIEGDINAGQQVVVAGNATLEDGKPVRVVEP